MLFESSFARGPLGFTLLEGTLEVVSVEPGSCAEQGGVRAFQRVMAVDGVAVSSHEGFLQQLGANARSHVRVRFRSNERPADASVASTGAGAGAGDDVRAPHAETSITWGDAAESKGGAKTRPLSKAADAVFFKGAEAPNWPLAKCRDAWSAEEDAKLMELLGGPSKIRWSTVASLLPGARRTGKQARERWHNQLNPETASKVRRARARCVHRAPAPHIIPSARADPLDRGRGQRDPVRDRQPEGRERGGEQPRRERLVGEGAAICSLSLALCAA